MKKSTLKEMKYANILNMTIDTNSMGFDRSIQIISFVDIRYSIV